MAYGVVRRAGKIEQTEPPPDPPARSFLGAKNLGTMLVVAFGVLMGFSSLRSQRSIRIAFQLVLIAYLGFLHGEMVSQAVVVGWAQNGVAWRSAPGLVVLVAAAFFVPLATRKQVYCHHLCPHGAAQQLVRRLVPFQLHVRGWMHGLLSLIPALLLAWVLVVAVLGLPFNLAALEPFDAYLFRVAGSASLSIAVAGLLLALFVPLAYCRYGCPTGALLNFLRRHGRGDRFGLRDAAAIALVILAAGLIGWSRFH
jgi:polyferredoxin